MGKFKLINQDSGYYTWLEGNNVPVGWNSRKPSIERDTLYHGAFTSFTVGLTFVFDGFDWLENIYSLEGILAKITIEFYEKDNQTKQWSIQDTGIIDFTTRNIVSTIEGGGVEYNILDTGFKQKVRNREDTEISYNKEESLDGDIIPFPVYKGTQILGIQVADTGITSTIVDQNGTDNFVLGIDNTYSSDNFQSVIARQSSILTFVESDCWYYSHYDSNIKSTININYDHSSSSGLATSYWNKYFIIKITFDDSGGYTSETLEEHENTSDGGGQYNYSDNIEVELASNEGIILYILHYAYAPGAISVNSNIEIIETEIDTDFSDTYEPTISLNIFPYEIFQRLKEAITGDTSPIDAEILNRPDTLNPSIEYGKYSKYAILNGLLMRSFDADEANISFNLKDFYTNFDKVFNIGLDFDGDNFTIKDKKDFYTQDLVHSFGKEDVVSDSIEKSLSLDYYYSDVEVGYVARTNETIGGLQEYISNASYNTALNVINNTLAIISELIANPFTIEDTRRMQKVSDDGNTETTDTSFDQDLFILDVVYNGVTYKQRTTEDFDVISGLPLITTPMNLSITSAQNLDKWGWMLTTGIQKYASTPVSFNKAELKQNIEDSTPYNVSTTIGTKTITENTDFPFNKFDPPIFAGTLIKVDVVATLDIYKAIKANPYGLIGVYNEQEEQMNYGWLQSFSLGATDKDTTMTLIEAKSVSFILKSWLWESGEQILWESGEFIALDD